MKVANFGVDHAVAVVRGRVSGVAATGTSTISEIGLISIDATISADTDDWNPTGLATASIIRATATAAWNLTGITAPAQDVLLILNNVGSNAITLVNDATSTAGNRFLLPGGTDLSLGADNGLWLVYDGTTNRWRVIGGTGGGSGGGGDLSQERFVASGGTPETFTLAATPTTVLCFVNGVEQDPDDVTLTGADVDVNTTAGDIVVIVYAGAAAASPWTKELVADDMSTLTGWTSQSGTWTAGGLYGVEETSGAGDAMLEFDTDMSGYVYRAIQATVRVVSTTGWVGVGFSDTGSWGTGDLSVGLTPTTAISWDRYGSGGSTFSFTCANNTDYVLQVQEGPQGFSVFVDGTYIGTIQPSAAVNAGRVALYCRNTTDGWLRNVTVWGYALEALT